MCLRTVDEKVAIPDEGIGYKAMSQRSHKPPRFSNPYYNVKGKNLFSSRPVTAGLNRWLKSMQDRVVVDYLPSTEYTSGFHIFTNAKEARVWGSGRPCGTVVKVAYRGVLHTGKTTDGDFNIVAKEMKILEVV